MIRSEDTSGPVTEIALSAIFKFISYGLIGMSCKFVFWLIMTDENTLDPDHEATPIVVENIAEATTHARFVGTDAGSDEVVLMKIVQVLRMLVLHPAGVHLSNESICEIMQSCFRICFEMRLSGKHCSENFATFTNCWLSKLELLRKTAEQALIEMVRLLYARLPQFPLQEIKGSVNYKVNQDFEVSRSLKITKCFNSRN